MPATPLTSALFAQMKDLRIAEDHPAAVGIRSALGVWPGDIPTDEAHPIIGFYLTVDANPTNPQLLCFMVGVTQFIRYEWTAAAAMTFVCGIERVTSVTETTEGSQLKVVIELDAQASVEQVEAETRQSETGTLQSVARSVRERARYTLLATEESDRHRLSSLSLGVRTAIAY